MVDGRVIGEGKGKRCLGDKNCIQNLLPCATIFGYGLGEGKRR